MRREGTPDEGPPPTYTGIIDSHPYASAATRKGVYVADAAGNDVLQVSRKGKVRTVAVLPPQPLVVTAELAKGQRLPDCTIGLTYNFEPVPTDVEVGKDGWLYVTTLPGGPEDPSFPPRGGVWKVNPWNGDATQLVGGLAGATNLALGRHGTIYVSELFAGRVSRIDHGTVTPLIDLPSPAALEYHHGKLYVGYDVFEPKATARWAPSPGSRFGVCLPSERREAHRSRWPAPRRRPRLSRVVSSASRRESS